MSPSFICGQELVTGIGWQEAMLCVAARLTPGPLVLCPLAPRSVPYPGADVTMARPTTYVKHPWRVFKRLIIKTKCTLGRGCDQSHTARKIGHLGPRQGDASGHLNGAKASSLDSNAPWMPGPAATTAASPGATWFRPLTSAPASVAMIQPAARSQGLSPAS